MPLQSQDNQNPQESQQTGGQSASHPNFELKQAISQAVILQLVSQSQLVLQDLLTHDQVFSEMQIFYPKTYQSIVNLVMAYEQLSVLLQEVGALQDVQEQEPEEPKGKEPAAKKSTKKGPQTEVEKKGRHKAVVGEEKQVLIGGRSYRRRYGEDHKWHYISKQHRQVTDQKELQRPKPGQEN